MLPYYLQMIESPEDYDKFSQLYEQYHLSMFSAAKDILGHEYDAEDATHAAFVSIIENLDKVDDINSKQTYAYVVTIVKNKAFDLLRARHPDKIQAYEEYMEGVLMAALPEDNELARALAKLPSKYRDPLLLHYNNGYTYKEIGKMLGKSEDAVRKMADRGRARLNELLRQEGFDHTSHK